MRDVLRNRVHLVRQHTSNVLRGQNILARNTGARFSGTLLLDSRVLRDL
jgi:hypothetical protein